MSTCPHSGNFPDGNYPFGDGNYQQDSLLLVDRPGILPPTAGQTSEELKRVRNRLAQRKHRLRKKAEEQGESVDTREVRSRKGGAAHNRATSIQSETQSLRLQTFGKETRRHRSSLVGRQEARDELLASTAVSIAPNQEILPSIIGDLDFSLIGSSNDIFDSNQDTDPARSISPQYYSSVFTSPSTAPPLFGGKGQNYFEEPYQRQSLSKLIPTTCDCNTQPAHSPTHFPGRRSDAGPPHQMSVPQHEAPEERQDMCYQLTSADEPCGNRARSNCVHMRCHSLPDHEHQDWQNQGMDLTDVNSPLLSVSIPAQPQLPSEMRLPTPGDSSSSSSAKSPPALQALPPATHAGTADGHGQSCATTSTSTGNGNSDKSTTTKTDSNATQQSPSPLDHLETRFERIFDAIEEAGFDSIDSMAASYYTARFPVGSLCAAAQSLSRRRHLRSFLEDVRDAARRWNAGESQGYLEAIIKSATGVYVGELAGLKDRVAAAGGVGVAVGCAGGTGGAARADSVKMVRDTVMGEEMVRLLKDEKRLLRERAPENWSLLMELARSAGLSQPEGSQIVCLFLRLLMG